MPCFFFSAFYTFCSVQKADGWKAEREDFVRNIHKYDAAVNVFIYDGLRSELYDFLDFKCSGGNAFRYGITCDM